MQFIRHTTAVLVCLTLVARVSVVDKHGVSVPMNGADCGITMCPTPVDVLASDLRMTMNWRGCPMVFYKV